ncbi:MAG: hydroxymethylbilane synthase, partial [Myxococcota bacterium]|nr:hydroxymethylbilane synthase [Myxococcota bacterium]
AQATWTRETLAGLHPDVDVRIQVISTVGDRVQDRPLHHVGGAGLFTREIERALLDDEVDVGVHSLKDLPALMRDGLVLAAVPEREDPRDALICPAGHGLADLPEGATLATGALRRRAQLGALRPDLKLTGIRGNLDTRLRKVRELPELDATLVAAAGLSRMGWLDRAVELLDVERFVPAGGQAALGIQVRADDELTLARVAPLTHPATERATAAERAFLARLEAGCHVPVAVHARWVGEELLVDGIIAALDGAPLLRDQQRGPATDAEALGLRLAERLLAAGGEEILASLELETTEED